VDHKRAELIQVKRRSREPVTTVTALGLVGAILLLAGVSTWLGADIARTPIEATRLAEATLRDAIASGNDEPSVNARLVDFRLAISNRPLDSKTRVAYASLMLGLSRRLDDLAVAAFHARLAARFAPVTLPVVRPAALILSHTGHVDEGLALTRSVFDFDPASAAELLERLESQVRDGDLHKGLADSPDAWLAWSKHLERVGRSAEAADRLRESSRRWPDHLDVLARRADLAVRHHDWETLEELFPPERIVPDERAYAVPILSRGRLYANRGATAKARAAFDRGLALDPDSRFVQLRAGEAYDAIGEYALARGLFNRVLFTLPQTESNREMRETLIYYLARIEDGHGEPAAALRLWGELLALNPDHTEAQRRIDDLTGFQR
jgi:tetratricopeptide (TPR) repeat protein